MSCNKIVQWFQVISACQIGLFSVVLYSCCIFMNVSQNKLIMMMMMTATTTDKIIYDFLQILNVHKFR